MKMVNCTLEFTGNNMKTFKEFFEDPNASHPCFSLEEYREKIFALTAINEGLVTSQLRLGEAELWVPVVPCTPDNLEVTWESIKEVLEPYEIYPMALGLKNVKDNTKNLPSHILYLIASWDESKLKN